MHHLERHLRLTIAFAALTLGVAVGGCQPEKPKENKSLKVTYTDLGPKGDVPAVMKGTIWELTNRTNDEPYRAATYGLVGRLRDTGDTTTSLPVRQWMVKEMARHGFGQKTLPGYGKLGPEHILRDPSYAIVRVDAFLPPGVREGEYIDVRVSALPGNKTTSLSGGLLFASDLYRVRGNSPDLEGVEVLTRARGPIVVNPAYALADTESSKAPSGQMKASLRSGTVMAGGLVTSDRPIVLRLRHPGYPMARAIENRINTRFQKIADRARKNAMPITYQVAAAVDQGLVEIYIPKQYRGDWQHFMGVVEQLYVNSSPAALVAKAKELTEEAVKPNVPGMLEITYALEGIGEPALQFTLPLMAHPSPEVAFAMARASVFIGDESGAAQDTLFRIAKNDQNPFQIAAIETLGSLPSSPERNQKIRLILESKNSLARIEAYKVLVRNADSIITTHWVTDPRDTRTDGSAEQKFALDVVETGGEPLIYASRSGVPRIALIGPKPQLVLPCHFTTMDNRLMISSDGVSRNVTIFFRDEARNDPIQMQTRPSLEELVARLGGLGAQDEQRLDFSYGEVAAILQSLAAQQKVSAAKPDGRVTLAPFIFEQPRDTQDFNDSAPVIPDSRPNTSGDASAAVATPIDMQQKAGG